MKNQGPESLRPDRGPLRRSLSGRWPASLQRWWPVSATLVADNRPGSSARQRLHDGFLAARKLAIRPVLVVVPVRQIASPRDWIGESISSGFEPTDQPFASPRVFPKCSSPRFRDRGLPDGGESAPLILRPKHLDQARLAGARRRRSGRAERDRCLFHRSTCFSHRLHC